MDIKEVREIIICEGNSTDNTWEVSKSLEREFPERLKVIKQDGRLKFNAVRCALSEASCEIVMIWDADNTVAIGDQKSLIRAALENPKALWTGDRLKGSREKGSMRFLNYIGNSLFAYAWAPFFGAKTDTLCGSKIFPRSILSNCPQKILKKDPFGDFSLLAGAVFGGLPIRSQPVNYLARSYGKTNIKRWSNGATLLRVYFAIVFARAFNTSKKEHQDT
jgi:glycosyltransferase involved in cell wall biosynthesis